MLTPETLPAVQKALADAGVDGWLLYDFRGMNPIAVGLLRLEGMTSRRAFAFIPTRGTPVALTHAIENVVVLIEPRNPEDPHLLGLYHGIALTDRVDSQYGGALPDTVTSVAMTAESASAGPLVYMLIGHSPPE